MPSKTTKGIFPPVKEFMQLNGQAGGSEKFYLNELCWFCWRGVVLFVALFVVFLLKNRSFSMRLL